jgi:DNA-binding NtrC family response regulator
MSQKNARIVVVDDDRDVLMISNMVLGPHFTEVTTLDKPDELPKLLNGGKIDVILLDMNFTPGITTGKDGIRWLKKIRELDPSVHVLMHTAFGNIDIAVEAMKYGAIDFLVKPWNREKLLATVKTTLELKRSKEKVSRLQAEQKVFCRDLESGYDKFIARSRAMKPVLDKIRKVAPTEVTVLILGENGTGKELAAREIHRNSNRKDAHFVKVDLGALPESLFESELFGHVKGAFTDAKEARPGRFEIASGGTLFLDEIGNLDVSMQSKLLSVLQSGMINRIGSNVTTAVDVRIICATNRPLYQLVKNGEFREDLLFRINTVEIELPPLRERFEDIPLIAFNYLDSYKQKYHKSGLKMGEEALERLAAYHWPGNIRELQHAVERAVIMTENDHLEPDDFLLESRNMEDDISLYPCKVDEFEKAAIQKALKKGYRNMDRVADEVGLTRSTLYRRIKKYGL